MRLRDALLAFIAVMFLVGSADARRNRKFGGKQFVSNGTFGVGLELGVPTGFNGKYFLSDNTALNFGLGWVYDRYYYDDRDGVHLYLDHLWHPVSLANAPAFQLPLYIGVGARIWDYDDYRAGYDGTALGIRVPVGLAFDFNNIPLDIYLQLTFVADLFFGYDCGRFDDCRRFGPHFEGSFGFRYWFN